MSSLLQQLNNESLLLMYIAGELPAEDRMEVEQMLKTDPRMRAQMEELRVAQEGLERALQAADAQERLALAVGTAARRVGQAVNTWNARRLAMPAAHEGRRIRVPWWTYPVAAAAVLVLAVAYWVMTTEIPGGPPQIAHVDPSDASSLTNDTDPDANVSVVLDPLSILRDDHDEVLDNAEAELYALSQPADDPSGIFMIGETDER
jgi:anti-sigma factor RsiW